MGLWVTPLSPAAAGRWPGEGVTLLVPILVPPGCCCWDPPGCCCRTPGMLLMDLWDAATRTPMMLLLDPWDAAARTPRMLLPGPPGCCSRPPGMLLPGPLGCCCWNPPAMLFPAPRDAATRSPGCCCWTPGMLLLEPWDAATGTPTMLFPDPLGCCYQDRGMLLPGPLGCCCQPPGMLLPDPRARGRLWQGAGQAGGAPPLPLPPAAALPWELPGVGVLGFFPSAETRRVRLVVTLRGCSPSLPVTSVEQERAARVCTVTL